MLFTIEDQAMMGKKLKFSDAWGILWKMLEIRFNYNYASALFFLI